MDKLKLTGRNLGRVFITRSDRMTSMHLLHSIAIRLNLRVENSAQVTFRLSRVSYRGPWNSIQMANHILLSCKLDFNEADTFEVQFVLFH